MKGLFFAAGFLLLNGAACAQSKNTIFFGSSVALSNVREVENVREIGANLQTKIGGMVTNNVGIGFNMETALAGNKSTPFSLTVFSRMYMGKPTGQLARFYVEAGVGAGHHVVPVERFEVNAANKKFMGQAYISPGINFFPANWIAFELAPEYRFISGANTASRLGGSAGLKIFLSEKRFTQIFPYTFNRPY